MFFYKHHTSNLHIIGIRFKMNDTIILYDLHSNELFIEKNKICEVSAKILIEYIRQKYLGNFQKSGIMENSINTIGMVTSEENSDKNLSDMEVKIDSMGEQELLVT